jgi:hypothetical protein
MTTLGAWLKGQGFSVDDENVPLGRESEWHGVDFLLVHHTVSDCDGSEESIADYCKYGASGTYPPLCQIVLGHSGKAWITCQQRSGQAEPGRASHAGSGNGYGVPTDSMNAYSLGIECQCDGSHKLATHGTQYTALIRLLAALSRRYDVPIDHIIGHKEWSSTGKVDPKDDMDDIRADVAAELEEEETVWSSYSGKPDGTLTISNAQDYEPLDFVTADPPSSGLEHHLTYINCEITWADPNATDGMGIIRVKYHRDDGDDTAYQDYCVPKGAAIGSPDAFLITASHWEQGEKGLGGRWHLRCEGDIASVKLGTRYAKIAVIG